MTDVTQPGAPESVGPRRVLRAGARPVKAGLLRGWRLAVRRSSRDDTSVTAGRRTLVLAPHPDDETLGCGATIARKLAAGADVRVVLATDGRFSHRSEIIGADELARIRAQEFVEACRRLGVADRQRVSLRFEEGSLGSRLHEVVSRLVEQIEDFQPDEVMVTSSLDWHDDHRMLNRALLLAVAGSSRAPTVREYPIWAWADGPWTNRPGRSAVRTAYDLVSEPVAAWRTCRPSYIRTGPYLARKRQALEAYRSQLTSLTGEPGWATFDDDFVRLFLGDRETFWTPDQGSG